MKEDRRALGLTSCKFIGMQSVISKVFSMPLKRSGLTETLRAGESNPQLIRLQLEYTHDHGLESPLDLQGDYPPQTKTTTELLLHCKELQMLFVGEDPLLVPLWPTDKGKLRFYVGNASREGFGGATQYPDGTVVSREGLWEAGFAEGDSNLREAGNQSW